MDVKPRLDWPPTPSGPSSAHEDTGADGEKVNVVHSHGQTNGTGRRGSMPNEQDVSVRLNMCPLRKHQPLTTTTYD